MQVDTFSFVEGEMGDVSGAQDFIELGLFDPDDTITTANMKFGFRYVESSATLFIIVNGSSATSFNNSTNLYLGQGKRHSIRISGSEIRFHIDHRIGQQPIYVAPGPPVFPYVVGIRCGFKTFVKGVTMNTQRLGTIYSESQQIADHGAIPGMFWTKIYQKRSNPVLPDGWPVWYQAQTRGGYLLLEDGGRHELEDGTGFKLKE